MACCARLLNESGDIQYRCGVATRLFRHLTRLSACLGHQVFSPSGTELKTPAFSLDSATQTIIMALTNMSAQTPSIYREFTLNLNRVWQPLKFITPKKAFLDLCSIDKHGHYSHLAMDIEYARNEAGEYDMSTVVSARPVDIDTWRKLPVRPCDPFIHSGRNIIRVPLVTICASYASLPILTESYTKGGVWKRDKATCQVTGERLTRETGDIGHDVAQTKGGQWTWTNTALMKKELNRMQGTKSWAEMGWNIKPHTPKGRKVFLTVNDAKHEGQKPFLNPV